MRPTLLWTANLLIGLGIGGLVLTMTGQADPLWARLAAAWPPSQPAAPHQFGVPNDAPLTSKLTAGVVEAEPARDQLATPDAYLEIDTLRVPSIDLVAEVVPARLVELPQGISWEVPPFKVGHGGGTAGAGQTGNSVLFGHITSRALGNVFLHLDGVHAGDRVYVSSGDQEFAYLVDDVRWVARTDMSVVQTTATPSMTLITCAGVWLPVEQDYAERLVVTAQLI